MSSKKLFWLLLVAMLLMAVPSFASVAFVQSNMTNCNSTSCSVTINAASGDALVVGVSYASAGTSVSSITDTHGDTFTQKNWTAGTSGPSLEQWTTITSGTSTTLTVNFGVANKAVIIVNEYSGVGSIGGVNSNKNQTGSTGPNSGLTTTDANDWMVNDYAALGTATISASTGTLRNQFVTSGGSDVGGAATDGSYATSGTAASQGVTLSVSETWLAVSVLLVPGSGGGGSGHTYYIATNGSDSNNGTTTTTAFATFSHADSVVVPGDTVIVEDGTYTSAVTTNTSGSSTGGYITWKSQNKWGAKLTDGSGATDTWTNNGNYVIIENFDISGGTAANHGVLDWASHTQTIGNHIHDIPVPISGGCTNGGAGIDHAQYTSTYNDDIGNWVDHIGTANASISCAHGIYHATANGLIENNVVNNVTKWAITTWHAGTNLTITNNTIFKASSGGIQIGQGDAGSSTGTANTFINNNIIVYSGIGVEEEGLIGTGNTYIDNLMYGNSTNWYNANNGNSTMSSTPTGTQSVDPKFVNYQADGTGDYHLTSSSPAIDHGTSSGAPSTDFDGNTRPAGAAYDIGAYEYGATSSGGGGGGGGGGTGGSGNTLGGGFVQGTMVTGVGDTSIMRSRDGDPTSCALNSGHFYWNTQTKEVRLCYNTNTYVPLALKYNSVTSTLTYPSVTAPGCSDVAVTVTGAVDGDVVSLGVPNASVPAGGVFFAWVSAADTVTVRYCALVTGQPASGTFRIDLFR